MSNPSDKAIKIACGLVPSPVKRLDIAHALDAFAAEAVRAEREAIRSMAGEAPDCGDNGCKFGGAGKGGMRTNGGCRCLKDRPSSKTRIYFERLAAAIRERGKL